MKYLRYALLATVIGSYAYGTEDKITTKTLEELYFDCLAKCKEKTRIYGPDGKDDLQYREYCFKGCLAKYQMELNKQLVLGLVDGGLETFKLAQEIKDKVS